jgi:hypothetical protein
VLILHDRAANTGDMNDKPRTRVLRLTGIAAAIVAAASLVHAAAGEPRGGTDLPFRDTFRPKPDAGWRWVREDPKAWRIGKEGLEVRVQPGNMWGPANDARNVMVRALPDGIPKPGQAIEVAATVENRPTAQWEQVDLVWYYDDSNMVKLGQEMVDGQLSIVMGREQADVIRTIAIVPIDAAKVELQLTVRDRQIRGRFRTPGGEWRDAGECDLPEVDRGRRPHVSLQFYQGPADAEHWARVSELTMRAAD